MFTDSVNNLKLQISRLKLIKFSDGDVDQTYLISFMDNLQLLIHGPNDKKKEEKEYNYPEFNYRRLGNIQRLVSMDSTRLMI